ncbi:hypothetical protein [Xanthomonas hortorum]|uniref:hypothetical protein n=1 Tax=Xanthomonas hortorum TaxID=56454 RepID=UPI0032E8642F
MSILLLAHTGHPEAMPRIKRQLLIKHLLLRKLPPDTWKNVSKQPHLRCDLLP